MHKTRQWEIEMMKQLENHNGRLKASAYALALVSAIVFVVFILWK
jgi:hypothetical protein